MFEPIVYKLRNTISFGGEEIDSLIIARQLIAKDLHNVSLNELKGKDFCVLISKITNQPRPLIDALSLTDFGNLMQIVSDFLSVGQET